MKKVSSAGLFLVVLWLVPCAVNAQNADATFAVRKKSGYTLDVSFNVKNGAVQSVSVDEWRPVNRSFHQRAVEAARGDADSTWKDDGDTTRIESYAESVTLTKRGKGFLLTMSWSDVRVLFTRRGARYVGKIL